MKERLEETERELCDGVECTGIICEACPIKSVKILIDKEVATLPQICTHCGHEI